MEIKEQVKNILLDHKGSDNAITSTDIDLQLGGLDYDSTNRTVRRYIEELLYEGMPIGSCSKGYYVITSKDELDTYINNLSARIKGIQDRQISLIENFGKYLLDK